MISVEMVPQDSFAPEKQYSLLVTSSNMESVTIFSPENIIYENYTNDYVNFFWT